MTLDPKLLQWITSVLLVLSGVQNLVVANRTGMRGGLRALSFLIAIAATAFGIYMIVNLIGVKV